MGIALGDYDNDGLMDLWVTNYQNEINALYKNKGNLVFSYASRSARVAATDESTVGWGTAFVDLECDGDEDLLVVNGHIELRANGDTLDQRPQVLENVEGKWFRLLPAQTNDYLGTRQSSRSLALSDFDRDGRMDFVVSRLNTDAAVVRNLSQTAGRYLKVKLAGTQSNRNAIGARVQLQVGDTSWMRQMAGSGTYAGTHDAVMHFGIPEALGESTIRLRVYWPSGRDETLNLDGLDREILVIEGVGVDS
jgi:hypothetical protein